MLAHSLAVRALAFGIDGGLLGAKPVDLQCELRKVERLKVSITENGSRVKWKV